MRNEPMRRNELPETCFSVLPSTGQLIIIKKKREWLLSLRMGCR